MDNLITITENNGQQVVSARELHTFLGAGSNPNTWFKNQVERAMLTENEDFVRVQIFESGFEKQNGGQNKIDYALTLSSAKEISMLNGGEKGKLARTYFLECEKIAKKVLSPAEQLLANAQMLVDIERKQKETDKRIDLLEAKTQTTSNYFTIIGYATLNKVNCGLKLAADMGRKASALCKQRGIETESIPDIRFGVVRTYPYPIIEEVFNQNIA